MESILGLILGIGKDLLDKFIPDPQQKAAAQLQLLQLAQNGELAKLQAQTQEVLAQLAVNQAEANSQDPFARRWRPFIGWVCGFGLGYQFLLHPLLIWATLLAGHPATQGPPDLDMGTLLTLLGGMLGLGAMRSYDKQAK